ncbi:hypothetical protein AMECASPLE_037841 [Ameca splendens]|uniref:Uncharacterized protein n=1 Tax=Ameca splendens TaxID=208324 RepID=A0ABV1AHS4_9TELE
MHQLQQHKQSRKYTVQALYLAELTTAIYTFPAQSPYGCFIYAYSTLSLTHNTVSTPQTLPPQNDTSVAVTSGTNNFSNQTLPVVLIYSPQSYSFSRFRVLGLHGFPAVGRQGLRLMER